MTNPIKSKAFQILIGVALLGSFSQAQEVFYLTDHLGSTRVVTNEFGAEQARYAYYPFGQIRGSDLGQLASYNTYTSQKFDAETSLFYYGARYYDPGLGRFVSVDPVVKSSIPQDLNPYAYTWNNPLRVIDPSGGQEKYFQILQEYLRWVSGRVDKLDNKIDKLINDGIDLQEQYGEFVLPSEESMRKWLKLNVDFGWKTQAQVDEILNDPDKMQSLLTRSGEFVIDKNKNPIMYEANEKLQQRVLKLIEQKLPMDDLLESAHSGGLDEVYQAALKDKQFVKYLKGIGMLSIALSVVSLAEEVSASEDPSQAAEIIDEHIENFVGNGLLGPPWEIIAIGAGLRELPELEDPYSSEDWGPYLDPFN
ncbi:MAG: RHS repeat-associated core domain-containing protein [Deltaproteobacteria bacterium]|nr:RHS repeat-associated core domain-containing protein [Deltaproteobacteria bacterium]